MVVVQQELGSSVNITFMPRLNRATTQDLQGGRYPCMLTELRALIAQFWREFVDAYQGSSNDPGWCKAHRMEIALMCYRRLARCSASQATSKQMVAYGHYLCRPSSGLQATLHPSAGLNSRMRTPSVRWEHEQCVLLSGGETVF